MLFSIIANLFRISFKLGSHKKSTPYFVVDKHIEHQKETSERVCLYCFIYSTKVQAIQNCGPLTPESKELGVLLNDFMLINQTNFPGEQNSRKRFVSLFCISTVLFQLNFMKKKKRIIIKKKLQWPTILLAQKMHEDNQLELSDLNTISDQMITSIRNRKQQFVHNFALPFPLL